MDGSFQREAEVGVPTVSASDIARLSGVRKAAVSNWRRRYSDFPAPVGGTSASPLYSLDQVEAWLTEHGKEYAVPAGERIWPMVRAAVEDLRLGDLVGSLGAFLVFHQRDPRAWQKLEDESDEALAVAVTAAITSTVPELPTPPEPFPAQWAELLRSVADFAGTKGHRAAFEFLRERYLDAHARRLSLTPPELATVMVRLAGATRGTVLDPACGLGTLLSAAQAAGAERLLGQDVSETFARITAVTLLLSAASADIAVGDALRSDAYAENQADSVVCNPPFSERSWGYDELAADPRWEYGLPPRGEPELAWLQHCVAHVRPGGHVVILMPAAAASRRAGRRLRGNLLRSGVLRAVISTPGTGAPAAPGPDLWVLRKPADGDPAPSRMLLAACVEDLGFAERAWRWFVDGSGQAPSGAQAIGIIDLLDDEIDLSPARHLTSATPVDHAAGFQSVRTRLPEAITRLKEALPELATSGDRVETPMTTLGELIKAGLVTVQQSPLKMVTGRGSLRVLTVADVLAGRSPSERTNQVPGLVTIRPGDVVVPLLSREPVARVAVEEAALGPQLLLFTAERMDPHFLAGYLRLARDTRTGRATSTSGRLDPRRVPIPLLDLAEQRRYGKAFRELTLTEDALREVRMMGEETVRLGFAGLAEGTLLPGTPRNEC
ncbi:N-6 DNA methylase [Amycolatopsis rhizosphaerae]|uniref:N-6 DNA methylase n=1 Tax=Amycolatopsis rhizosphaerae TaxID=2053003 RepID=A0A558D5R4_9PSEU|nr:N-6 DNA methylase [Amycolatopsis rhizosphaerae]TVT56348.1 N-6 DNA methylase [Amycolatopsis rhizosphaerae]